MTKNERKRLAFTDKMAELINKARKDILNTKYLDADDIEFIIHDLRKDLRRAYDKAMEVD